ncbi:MAG: prepilin-type N-terminal cleavage/methylation domain-containing protein [Acidobacteria bacterium]|nr:prepilin-type N-terminal cleavage/methylation domain-containing protein [Acidobacteriota bacterium]
MQNRSQSGFSLIEVLVAALILAVAVSALLANLSTSTSNLFRTNDIDRLTFLSKRKMDELISVQAIQVGAQIQGVLALDEKDKAIAGFSYSIFPVSGIGINTGERVERVRLETWLQSGSRRRTMQLESFRRVKLQ